MIGIAVALEKVGHVGLAARMTVEYSNESALIKEPAVAVRLADALARDHRVVDALELADTLKQRGDDFEMASWFFEIAALRVADALSGRERTRYRQFLEGRLAASEEIADNHQIAIAHYNLANHLRGSVRPSGSFHHYRLAAKLYPAYRDFEYWCREVAGVLYEAHRFQAAVFFYQRAKEIGPDWPVNGLLGDALLFAGRYADAHDSYKEALSHSEPGMPEWALKAWALQFLRDQRGIDVQMRLAHEAERLAAVDTVESEDERAARLNAALSQDLLCGLAWFNLGVQANRHGDSEDAFLCFLMAALCERQDTEAWANALALAFRSDVPPEFVPLIAETAYQANGDAMLEQMALAAQDQPPEFQRAEFLNAMETMLRASPTRTATVSPDQSDELHDTASHERLSFEPPEA